MEVEAAVEQNTADPGYDFEAGLLCLDYANTADWHASEHPVEALNNYSDLVAWTVAAGILPAQAASELLEQGARQPEEAARALARAIELREVIFRIFSATAGEQPVDPADTALFNQFLRDALAHVQLQIGSQEGMWGWEEHSGALERPFWPVVRSALDVFTSDQLKRVGQCQDTRGCGWLFLDTTRNHSRRWCSMDSLRQPRQGPTPLWAVQKRVRKRQ